MPDTQIVAWHITTLSECLWKEGREGGREGRKERRKGERETGYKGGMDLFVYREEEDRIAIEKDLRTYWVLENVWYKL